MNHGGDKMLLMGSTTTHRNFHITLLPPLCEQCDSIGQTKRYNGVCSRDQPRVRQHYEHCWFWFDLTIAHTQVKVWQGNRSNNWSRGPIDGDIIFLQHTHTHTKRYPLTWTKSDKLLSSNSPSCCLAQPTSSGISNTDSWRRGDLEENQHDHELNIAVRWQPCNTSEKIFGTSRTTDMLLSLRTTFLSEQDDKTK